MSWTAEFAVAQNHDIGRIGQSGDYLLQQTDLEAAIRMSALALFGVPGDGYRPPLVAHGQGQRPVVGACGRRIQDQGQGGRTPHRLQKRVYYRLIASPDVNLLVHQPATLSLRQTRVLSRQRHLGRDGVLAQIFGLNNRAHHQTQVNHPCLTFGPLLWQLLTQFVFYRTISAAAVAHDIPPG